MTLPSVRLRQVFRLASILLATEILLNLMGSAAMAMTLTSPAFKPNGQIPSKYTCEGDDISPPLAWNGVPEGTKSLVLIIDDPDAPDPKAPQRVCQSNGCADALLATLYGRLAEGLAVT